MGKKLQIAGFTIFGLSLFGLTAFIVWFKNSSTVEFRTLILGLWSLFKPFIFAWSIIFFLGLALIFIFLPKVVPYKSGLTIRIKSQELSGVLPLLDGDPQAAITKAFTILEDKLRKMTGLTEGNSRIREVTNKAFGEIGLYTYNGDTNEDIGIRNLLDGAFTLFRNPHAHQINEVDQDNANSVIVVVDVLLAKINKSKHRK